MLYSGCATRGPDRVTTGVCFKGEVILSRKVSILIPTRNRAASLKRLLQSLETSASLDGIPLEIIVVNNHSTDATSQVLMEALAEQRRFPIQVLTQSQRGKSWALNLALGRATGSLVLLLDDDVSVDKFCVAEHVAAYRNNKTFDAIQGKVLAGVDPQGHPADMSRLREYNIPMVDHGEECCEVGGFTGTNVSFKREVFVKAGLFDTRLGPGASGFSEDTEYSRRIRETGFKIGYSPKAIVYHELNPERYGSSYNRNVQYRKGISRSIYRKDSLIFRVLPDLIGNCFRYLAYTATGRRQKAYKTQGRIAKNYGYIAGKVQKQVLQHRRSR
jgi:glycosyltransferase involved in cell wall biosynthesis